MFCERVQRISPDDDEQHQRGGQQRQQAEEPQRTAVAQEHACDLQLHSLAMISVTWRVQQLSPSAETWGRSGATGGQVGSLSYRPTDISVDWHADVATYLTASVCDTDDNSPVTS